LGTLIATVLQPQILPAQAQSVPTLVAQSRRQRSVVLGVVRSSDNAAEWQAITARLRALGSNYQIIDWEQVQRGSDFAPVTVMFLPNVETISSEQLLALQAWLSNGGRLVVSGAIGHQSSLGVQQALRSLLGAYWAFPLPQSARLQPVSRYSQDWVQQGEVNRSILGGALVPSGFSSETVATWQDIPAPDSRNPARQELNAAAIVVSERTIFLGWQWGSDPGMSEFDSRWLGAAIDHYGTLQPTASPPAASPPTASPPTASAAIPSTPISGAAPTLPQPVPPTLPTPPPPVTPTQDPAEQAAPAGLNVEMSPLPITTLEAIAMRQELENLIGRFESALLSADSFNRLGGLSTIHPPEIPVAEMPQVLTASATERIPAGVPDLAATNPLAATHPTVQAARRIMSAFPDWVARRDYSTARQQWLQARQMLWDNFPTDRPSAQPEIRAVWLDRGTIVQAGSPQGLAEIFDRLSAAGINTIFFETINAGYPIYPSQIAPQQNPLVQGWDPLAAAVELAHQRGMELHAWVWTFAVGNRAHNALLNLPPDYLGPVIAAHPDWANYDNAGSNIPPGQAKPFLDPANPAARQYLLSLFNEIITKYEVDGLQLDYIRYPFQDPGAGRSYGYGLAARQQFQQLTGVDPLTLTPDSPLWQQWTEFRTEQINSFVAETAQILRRQRSSLILSTAVFPLSEHERIQKLQQDWEVWAQRGDVDLIVTMSYAMDTNSFLRLAQPWLTHANLGSVLVLPSIRLLNLPEAMTIDQIQAIRDLPAGGYALFAVANLDQPLQTIFDRTQGSQRSPAHEPIPYRQPFAAAAIRYAALEREWGYLLANGQLWIRDPELTQWRTQAAELRSAFDRLSELPSQQRLQVARTQLQSFQAAFDDWMRLTALSESYRVHTWQYRLSLLENLLNYGERVVLEPRNSPPASPNSAIQN
jgi:uncharacterized lipoprotein YddW (UPF0748 family)